MDLSPEDLQEVRDGKVLRLAPVRFLAPGTKLPHPGLFALGEKDIEEARENQRPPMLSVFDRARTSIAEARRIVAGDGELFAFELEVEEVCVLSARLPPQAMSIRVLRNLLLPKEKADLPGIKGHCGITGLHREPGIEKKHYRNVRDELCRLAHLVEE